MIEPVAFLVLDKERIQLLTTKKQGAFEAVIEAAPDLIASIKSWADKRKSAGNPDQGV